jgi:hypothetical protein
MERVIAIDPGPTESGVCVIDTHYYRPLYVAKVDNHFVLDRVKGFFAAFKVGAVIEMIGHYGTGMPAGKEVFDTCVWIGRFIEQFLTDSESVQTLPRTTVKLHLCGTPRAKDPNVTQALVDRFAPLKPNYGKGTKKEPGWFYGFSADMWAAYALGVTYIDMKRSGTV